MSFSLSNRALLRGLLAGAVVLTGTACSRSDRTESGRDNNATILPDTSSTTTGAVTDTSAVTETGTVGDTAAGVMSDTATPSGKDTNVSSVSSDTSVSQSAIGTDTAAVDTPAAVGDTSSTEMAVTTNTAVSTEVAGDTTAVEMARDTSTAAEQADTPSGYVAMQATIDTNSQARAIDVTTTDEAADETADEQVVSPEDRGTVAASESRTDEVGAAAIGGDVTGAEAVALMSRDGVRCAVVDPEENEGIRWDMSNTPVTLNPCGMGSMVLSKIWTEASARQE